MWRATERISELEQGLRLIHVNELFLDVSVGSSSAERVPVNARLHEGDLTVAGRSLQFGTDATKELLRYFSFRSTRRSRCGSNRHDYGN